MEAPSELVVIEDGATLNASVHSEKYEHTVVLIGAKAESPRDLTLRLTKQLDAMERLGKPVNRIVVAMSARRDRERFVARVMLTCVMVSHLLTRGSGELELVAADDASRLHRFDVWGLMETLLGQLGGSDVSVRARFPVCTPRPAAMHAHAA